jgi:hypothetical protein
MHLRRRLVVPLAVPVALAMLAVFPLTARASVGVGVQAGPVRLSGLAHPGGSYALPAVYVVNTGTEAETVRVHIQRLSHDPGRYVPPSWIHAGPGVRLAPHQAAQIPLQLVLPDGARPGGYLSDVVVAGSASVSAGTANFGVAAATKLEFRVGGGPVQGLWPAVPGWSAWVIGGLLLLGIAALGVRRSGLRIRVERRAAGPGVLGPGIIGSGAAGPGGLGPDIIGSGAAGPSAADGQGGPHVA